MTPSCRNCHGASEAKVPNPSVLRLSVETNPPSHSPTCTAEKHWPAWLKAPVPKLEDLEWWTRSNFEKTLQTKRQAEGKVAPPFRIFVKDGSLTASLKPNSFSFPVHAKIPIPILGTWETDREIFVVSGDQGEIASQLSIQDNKLPLLMKGLLEFKDIHVGDGSSLFLETAPNQISVGNYGDLHLILSPKAGGQGILNFLTPIMTPTMPIGYDWPHGDENMDPACAYLLEEEAKRLDCPPSSDWVYQDRGDPRRDVILTHLLPKALLNPQGRLPKAYDLEDLVIRVFTLISGGQTGKAEAGKKAAVDLKQILNAANLKPGTQVTLALKDIQDFFLPGVLDLGPSQATVQLTVGKNGEILIDMSEFALQVDAMDYPNRETWEPPKADDCQPKPHVTLERPGTRVDYAILYPGAERKDAAGEVQKPGIHAVFYPNTKQLTVKANIHVDGNFSLPLLGHVDASGDLLAETGMAFTSEGVKVIPKTTALTLKDWTLFRVREKDAKAPKQEPGDNLLAQQVEISLTDDPHQKSLVGKVAYFAESPFELKVSAMIPGEKEWVFTDATKRFKKQVRPLRNFEIEGTLRLPLSDDGAYDLAGLKNRSELAATARWMQGGQYQQASETYTADLKLSPSSDSIAAFGGEGIDYTLEGGLERSTLVSNPKNPKVKTPEILTLLKGLHFALRQDKLECSSRWEANLTADQVQYPLEKQKVELNGIYANVKLDRFQVTQDYLDLSIPLLDIAINSEGSKTGPVRGKISLTQSPNKNLQVFWDRLTRALKVQGLDLTVQAHGLHILSPKMLAILDRRVQNLGLDGRLAADFQMFFPEDKSKWNGEGLVQLIGNDDGDVYFENGKGERIGPHLIRNTSWDFRRINNINWQGGWAQSKISDYNLRIIINLAAINLFSGGTSLPDLGPDTKYLDGFGPFEMASEMGYDNQPITPNGFQNRIREYVDVLYEQCLANPDCTKRIHPKKEKTEGGVE